MKILSSYNFWRRRNEKPTSSLMSHSQSWRSPALFSKHWVFALLEKKSLGKSFVIQKLVF